MYQRKQQERTVVQKISSEILDPLTQEDKINTSMVLNESSNLALLSNNNNNSNTEERESNTESTNSITATRITGIASQRELYQKGKIKMLESCDNETGGNIQQNSQTLHGKRIIVLNFPFIRQI
jgi:hypothetical protein